MRKRLRRIPDEELRQRIKDLTSFLAGASSPSYEEYFARDLSIAKELLRLRKRIKK